MSEQPEQPNFEDLLRQLQKVTQQLSRGDLPLEQSLRLYEQGVELTRKCEELLQRAEAQIKQLSKNEGKIGEVEEKSFQPTDT